MKKDLQFIPAFERARQNNPIVAGHVASWRLPSSDYDRDFMLQTLVVTMDIAIQEMRQAYYDQLRSQGVK